MCGIAGIVSNGTRPVENHEIENITAALGHRGPDGQHIWISANCRIAFGHRRLAIVDPTAASDQPMHSADGRYSMVFNGEIYNFLEMRSELIAAGRQFKTDGDAEVLLQAWAQWGWDMLPRLNGMWAFAISDNESGAVYLSRDRFGVKPLVYAETSAGLYFASENRALLSINSVSRAPNLHMLRRAVFDPFSHEASEYGLFSALRKLPAGHNAEYRNGKLSIHRWWNTLDHIVEAPATLAEAADQFRDLFFDSVRMRMRSDVSIGTCLSGGFDSTAVTSVISALAQRQAGGNKDRQASDWRHAFVASFPGLGHDETPQALEAAKYAGIEPAVMNFSMDDGCEYVDAAMDALDDIYISLPTAIWKIYREVSAHNVKVTLDGHGADEMFGGYRTAGRPIQFHIRSMLSARSGRGAGMRDAADRIRRTWFRANDKYFLRTSPLEALYDIETPFDQDPVPSHWNILDRRLYSMFHSDILPTLLRNYDRLSMAHGVEIRMPFMDWRIATFVMSLPAAMKSDDRYSKLVAREAMKGHMPENIRSSPRKVGFSSQMPDWMNGTLGIWAEQSLHNAHPALQEIADVPRLLTSIRKHNANKSWDWSTSDRIWPYVNLNHYLNRYA